jgi:NAD(P)H-dependent FMN reductase
MSYQPRILAFAGSARKGSFNKMLVKIAVRGAEATGAKVTYVDLRDFLLPVYDADLEAVGGLPENALRLKSLLEEHDGLLIASPENNSTISALLKNVLDWTSRRLPGEAAYTGFDGKVAALLAASTGALGGVRRKGSTRGQDEASGKCRQPQVTVNNTHIDDSSAWLGDGVDERRLATLDHGDGFLERRPEILRVGDRALGPPAQ